MMLMSMCDFPWWLLWLLPLIGFILGWLLSSILKNNRIREVEDKLNSCISEKTSLRGEYKELSTGHEGLKEVHLLLSKRHNELSQNINSKNKLVRDVLDVEAPKKISKMKLSSHKGDLNYDVHAKLKNDNLQIIEGVGPKMEELLKKNGIMTWRDLSSKDGKSLRALLDRENPTKYRIIDPSTWAEQATYAAKEKWNVLTDFQRNLDTGKTNTLGKTDAKVEKVMIRMGLMKRWKQDDLKAIEGIGPKIEGLFHAAGIMTWKALSESSVDRLKEILVKAGDRYRLADPETWPDQAKMAYEGSWNELAEYQDFLKGGK